MNRKVIKSFRLNANLVKLIRKYAKLNKTTSTQIVEYALIEYFKSKNENIF